VYFLSPEVFQINWSAFQREPAEETAEILKHRRGCADVVAVSAAP